MSARTSFFWIIRSYGQGLEGLFGEVYLDALAEPEKKEEDTFGLLPDIRRSQIVVDAFEVVLDLGLLFFLALAFDLLEVLLHQQVGVEEFAAEAVVCGLFHCGWHKHVRLFFPRSDPRVDVDRRADARKYYFRRSVLCGVISEGHQNHDMELAALESVPSTWWL
jgi:hypothetical protein